nr:hypothetical protein [Tanacetum cinerariifolium]
MVNTQIREEFHTSSGPSDSGGNPPPVTIHTWLKRFNKQKPRSFEKATAPVDAENWISHMEKIFDVMGCEDAFKTRLVLYKFEGNALAWWKAYKQAKGGDVWLITVTWAEFKKLFFLQFFPRAEQEPAGTAEKQAKNLQWGLRRSTLNHLMCISFTDVAQMVNTHTDADLSVAVQNALQTLLPQIRAEIHEEFRTSSGPSGAGGNPPSVTIHTWLKRFNKQKPYSFEKATAPVPSSPGVPLRATLTQFALRVDADTQESVVEMLVLASSVVKLAIYRKITRRTPLRVHLVRLIRSQVFSSLGVPLRATPTRSALRVDADTQESVVELLVPASSVVKLAIRRRIARRTQLQIMLLRLQ